MKILPGSTLGMLGGGQLGRMFTIAARTMGYEVIVLDPDPDSPAGGFDRQWTRLDAGIAIHHGYAFQWFMLATALVVIWVVVNLRKRNKTQEES